LREIASTLLAGVCVVALDETHGGERARRGAARETIVRYHEERLLLLLERVRNGFARLDAGEIDAFDLDDLIHRYERSARELWKFCGQTGSDVLRAARTLEYWREQGEGPPDWWEAGEPRRRRWTGRPSYGSGATLRSASGCLAHFLAL
jgi:hypothetical protein